MTVGCRISARGFLPLVHSFTYGKWVLRRTNRPQNIHWQAFSPSHPPFSLPLWLAWPPRPDWHKDHPLQSLLGLPFLLLATPSPLPAIPPPHPRPCRGLSRGIGNKLLLVNRPQAPARRPSVREGGPQAPREEIEVLEQAAGYGFPILQGGHVGSGD